MTASIYPYIEEAREQGRKLFAVLIDPDKTDSSRLPSLVQSAEAAGANLFLVGGSLLLKPRMEEVVRTLKTLSRLPVLLFPGSTLQLTEQADGLLLLSLLSGRNPDLLIGRHVEAAPMLRNSSLEVIPTGYLLVDCGRPTTASYISGTQPLPYDKPEIAAATAYAGQLLGLKLIYLDGGSGASRPVSADTIAQVREWTDLPIIVGGGMRSAEAIQEAFAAGADVAVVGTALEENPSLMEALGAASAK